MMQKHLHVIDYTHHSKSTPPIICNAAILQMMGPGGHSGKFFAQLETLIIPISCAAQLHIPGTRNKDSHSAPALAQAHSLSLATKLHVMKPRKLCFFI